MEGVKERHLDMDSDSEWQNNRHRILVLYISLLYYHSNHTPTGFWGFGVLGFWVFLYYLFINDMVERILILVISQLSKFI